MDYVIVDLEATCWEADASIADKEIIEIGAVRLDGGDLQVVDEFDAFVRPLRHPLLSEFCRNLTRIGQGEIDQASPLPRVFQNFLDWIGPEPFKLCSWGEYDHGQFQVELRRHGLRWPADFRGHVNLEARFALTYNLKRSVGLREALRLLGIGFDGTQHRGIDDARNIAKIAQVLLRSAFA
ncbi:MAG: 3'-5' exonuclease [Elusimicrobiota bacterium]